MFDDHGCTIDDDLSINIKGALPMNASKVLYVARNNKIDMKYIKNHRNRANNYDS